MKRYKNSAGDVLSNLIGEGGVRTDVKVSFTPVSIAILALIIPVTVAAGIIIANAIKPK